MLLMLHKNNTWQIGRKVKISIAGGWTVEIERSFVIKYIKVKNHIWKECVYGTYFRYS